VRVCVCVTSPTHAQQMFEHNTLHHYIRYFNKCLCIQFRTSACVCVATQSQPFHRADVELQHVVTRVQHLSSLPILVRIAVHFHTVIST
jgi:hypothetical protein